MRDTGPPPRPTIPELAAPIVPALSVPHPITILGNETGLPVVKSNVRVSTLTSPSEYEESQ